jgi:hypothetical protein
VSDLVYTIVTVDGADDDGCTLYVLHDEHMQVITSCAWPQPLERVAEGLGATIAYGPTLGLHELEHDPPMKGDQEWTSKTG